MALLPDSIGTRSVRRSLARLFAEPQRGPFRPGAIKRRGLPKNTAALIGMSACQQPGTRRNGPPVAERGRKRPFDEPIPLPRGGPLVTLGTPAITSRSFPRLLARPLSGKLLWRR
jgi:hypothetical protein